MEQHSKGIKFLEKYEKVIIQILLQSSIEELSSIIFGSEENNKDMIVMYYKNYIIIYSEIFKEKVISIEKNLLKKYSYLRDKGANYLIVEFTKKESYNLKIKVTDVKVPRHKLKSEMLKTEIKLEKCFIKGKIKFNQLDSIENEEENKSKNEKPLSFYILLFMGILDLIVTILIFTYFIYKQQ